MVVTYTKVGVTPEILLGHARTHFPTELNSAFKRSADKATRVAKVRTPVYNPAKYPAWVGMRHAHGIPGGLKRSITRGTIKQTVRTLKTSIYSKKHYAGYIERGFWHVRAGRYIPGRFMIFKALNTTHRIDFPRQVRYAFKRAFMEM